MSERHFAAWARRFWAGLYRGLCEAGNALALQNGLLLQSPDEPAPGPARERPRVIGGQATNGV